jgi:hypothetical protein
MRLRTIIAIASLLLSPTLARADGVAPDYSGEMTISCHPIMCLIPPCPPGTYEIAANGEIIARGDVIFIETGADKNQYFGQYLDIDTVTGDLWIGGQDKTDYDGIGLPEGAVLVRIAAR